MDFLIFNGKIVREDEVNISYLLLDIPFIINRKIWFGFGGIPMLAENIADLSFQLKTLNLTLPKLFRNYRELFRITKRLLNKNKLYRSGYINFQIINNQSEISFIITCEPFTTFDFPISNHGLLLNFSDIVKYSGTENNNFGFHNLGLWKNAQTKIQNTIYHNSIILNEENVVCEGIEANIFIINGKILFTPSLETGCYDDIFRKIIIDTAFKLDLRIVESSKIRKKEISNSGEIFLASEAHGIQWVIGVENKRFLHSYSSIIHDKINEYLKSKVN